MQYANELSWCTGVIELFEALRHLYTLHDGSTGAQAQDSQI